MISSFLMALHLSAALSFLASFAVFIRTVSGTVFPDDTPWTMTAVYLVEHQHPPGYPLWTMLARVAAALPLGGPAFRLNVFSCALMALAAALLGVVSARIASRAGIGGPRSGPALSVATALCFALSWTGWEQALSFKGGVYASSTILVSCLAGVVSGALLPGVPLSRAIQALGFLSGLGLAHHWMSLLVNVPAFLMPFAWWRRGELGSLRARNLFMAALFAALGVSSYLLLPIRSGTALVNWGNPGSLRGFASVVTRSQYSGEERREVAAGYWRAKAAYVAGFFLREMSPAGLALGAAGLTAGMVLFTRPAAVLLASALLTALSVFLYDLKPPDCFFSRAHFYLPAIAWLAVFIPWAVLPLHLSSRRIPRSAGWAVVGAVVAVGALSRLPSHSMSRAFVPRDYILNVLDSVPRGAFLLCEGESDWFPALYATQVERYRADVVPLNYYLMRTGYRPFLAQYARKYPVFVRAGGGGYVLALPGPRPVYATIEVEDPNMGSSFNRGNLAHPVGGEEDRVIPFSRLRWRGFTDSSRLTEMYSSYSAPARSVRGVLAGQPASRP